MLSTHAIAAALMAATLFSTPTARAQETAIPACAPAPGGAAQTISVSGQQQSAPFTLDGGAYRVEWTMDKPTTPLSFIELKSADDPSVLRSETILNASSAPGASSATTYAYK